MRIIKAENLNFNNETEFCRFFINHAGALPYETLCAAFLDKELDVQAVIELDSGGANTVSNDLSDVLRCAITYSCKRVVLCHNHPDGRVFPSDFDIFETKRTVKLLENNGISLLEHIIVTKDACSFLLKDQLITL